MSEKQEMADDMRRAGEAAPLSPHRAFVVQFRAGAHTKRGHCSGRVEHIVSGQARRVQSLEELTTFVAQVLATLADQESHRTQQR